MASKNLGNLVPFYQKYSQIKTGPQNRDRLFLFSNEIDRADKAPEVRIPFPHAFVPRQLVVRQSEHKEDSDEAACDDYIGMRSHEDASS